MSVTLRLLSAALAVLVFGAVAVSAESIRWELVDSGVLRHSTHGEGIEMRITPNPVPEGLFGGSVDLANLLAALCGHYAPSVIPFVRERAEIADPRFVAVRITTGGTFGRFALQAFKIKDGTCGEEID